LGTEMARQLGRCSLKPAWARWTDLEPRGGWFRKESGGEGQAEGCTRAVSVER